MSIFLTVLKIIGIILLVILGLILLILLAVLLVPFRYRVKGSYHGDTEGLAAVSWLGRLVDVRVSFIDKKLDLYVKLFWLFRIGILEKLKGRKKETEEEEAASSEEKENSEAENTPKEEGRPKEIETPKEEAPPEETPQEGSASPETPGTPDLQDKDEALKDKIAALIHDKAELLKAKKEELDQKLNDLKDKKDFLMRERVKAAISHVLRMVFKMLKHIAPKKLSGKAELGLKSPADTGQLLAVLSATMPLHKNRIRVIPDFEEEHIDVDARFSGRIYVIVLVVLAVRIILNKNVIYVLRNYKKHFS